MYCILTSLIFASPVPVLAEGSGVTRGISSQLPAGAHLSEHLYGDLPGLSNVGRVNQGVYRGAQPEAEGYATLKKMGIRTVINLRSTESEKEKVEKAGMRSIEVPMEMTTDGLKEKVDRVVALMADPANQPLFVHCRQGRDRTGIVVAAFRMKVENWSLADAEAEMESYGFNDIWIHFKRFIRNYGQDLKK
jgi:protein tyrosine/serine phosphatase